MNKISVIILSSLCFCFLVNCGPGNYVGRAFAGVFEELRVQDKKPLFERRDLYRVYKLDDEEIERILQTDLSEFGYEEGWKEFKDSYACSKDCRVNGRDDEIFVNFKKGYDSFNFIGIFVNLSKNELVFIYGITYGR